MNVLCITNLFPNKYEPNRGMFNFQLFMALAKLVNMRIIAPIPYYPGMSLLPGFTHFGRVKGAVDMENLNNIKVYHPRYFSLPKIGRSFYGYFYFIGIRKLIQEIKKDFDFDVILSSFAYPDGYASFLLAKKLNKPLVSEILGSDIYLHAKHYFRKHMILKSLKNSQKVIAMSEGLKKEVIRHGVLKENIIVNYNGVNKNIFFYKDKMVAKKELGLDSEVCNVLFVGNLVPVKGIENLLHAMAQLVKSENKKFMLYIIGYGSLKSLLSTMSYQMGLEKFIHFIGEKNHNEISTWMQACDLFCLPSYSEGVPNVILEAMSCGTPVVASEVGGIPEIVTPNEQGILVPPGDPNALAKALIIASDKQWNYKEISNSTSKFTWDNSAKKLYLALLGECGVDR
jgi:glycosyltransferase involved in cell wall biosynthesis